MTYIKPSVRSLGTASAAICSFGQHKSPELAPDAIQDRPESTGGCYDLDE
jgi:hypothetical protein